MEYTKKDKEELKRREVEDAENPMVPEDMPEQHPDIDVQIEKLPDGTMCIKFMQPAKTK